MKNIYKVSSLLIIFVLALVGAIATIQPARAAVGFHISGRNLLDVNNNNFIIQDVAVCAGAGTDCSGALLGNGFNNGNNGNSRVGYTLGGGIEWMFLPNWSVKAEALYYDLGRNNNNNNARLLAITCNGATCAVPGGLFASSLITQNSNRSNGVIARAGINYHFTWGAPAPVVARY